MGMVTIFNYIWLGDNNKFKTRDTSSITNVMHVSISSENNKYKFITHISISHSFLTCYKMRRNIP
jgi:hypothetical protein